MKGITREARNIGGVVAMLWRKQAGTMGRGRRGEKGAVDVVVLAEKKTVVTAETQARKEGGKRTNKSFRMRGGNNAREKESEWRVGRGANSETPVCIQHIRLFNWPTRRGQQG